MKFLKKIREQYESEWGYRMDLLCGALIALIFVCWFAEVVGL